MDKWFVILLGVLVAALYVPPIVVPIRHRDLCRRLNTKSFYRRFSVAPTAIGILAMLASDDADLHHRLLFAFGVIEIVLGIYLLALPGLAVSQVRFLLSKPLTVWVVRGVSKFTLGLTILVWGICCF